MAKETKTQVQAKHFFCYECRIYWKTEDFKEKDGGFVSNCPECKDPTQNVSHYFANLDKMHLNATGPKTEEGKARSSMNNFKTGLHAKQLNFIAPANHGKYLECEECVYSDKCINKEMKYCPVNLAPMLEFMAAYQEGRITDLKKFAGFAQGRVFLIMNQALQEIFSKGTLVETTHPNYKEYKDNPLIRRIPELFNILGFTSDQQEMNPKAEEEGVEDLKSNLILIPGNDYIKDLTKKITEAVKAASGAGKERGEDPIKKQIENDLKDNEKDSDTEMPEEDPFDK